MCRQCRPARATRFNSAAATFATPTRTGCPPNCTAGATWHAAASSSSRHCTGSRCKGPAGRLDDRLNDTAGCILAPTGKPPDAAQCNTFMRPYFDNKSACTLSDAGRAAAQRMLAIRPG
eukprot:160497-Chlamydomonas_euryale.AAC.1